MAFLHFAAENAKEAAILYFEPLGRLRSWLADEERSVDVRAELGRIRKDQQLLEARVRDLEAQLPGPFDSPTDLSFRVHRLRSWFEREGARGAESLRMRIEEIETLLDTAQFLAKERGDNTHLEFVLADLRRNVRAAEIELGFEKQLLSPELKRSSATGD